MSNLLQAIDNAESSDESNPEAFQIRARYQIVRGLFDEAKVKSQDLLLFRKFASRMKSSEEMAEFANEQQISGFTKDSMRKSLDLWLPRFSAILENKQEIEDFDPVETCPLLYVTR